MSMNRNIDSSIEAAAVFRTLADPFRLHIFTAIVDSDTEREDSGPSTGVEMAACVEEISRGMNLSPELVEQHILELTRARLVSVGEDAEGRLLISVNHELLGRVRRLASGESEAEGP